VFSLGGKRREDLLDIFSLGKTVQSFGLEEINMKHFRENINMILLLEVKNVENSFMVMGDKFEGKTLDWTKFKNGEFMW